MISAVIYILVGVGLLFIARAVRTKRAGDAYAAEGTWITAIYGLICIGLAAIIALVRWLA